MNEIGGPAAIYILPEKTAEAARQVHNLLEEGLKIASSGSTPSRMHARSF